MFLLPYGFVHFVLMTSHLPVLLSLGRLDISTPGHREICDNVPLQFLATDSPMPELLHKIISLTIALNSLVGVSIFLFNDR